MSSYDRLKKKKEVAHNQTMNTIGKLEGMSKECGRIAEVAHNSELIIRDLDEKFERITRLQGVDVTFLFFATALQCIRQYVIGAITQRKDHNESDKLAHDIQKKLFGVDDKNPNYKETIKQFRESGTLYRATTEEILNSYSVPYDVTKGTKQYGVDGFDVLGKGLGLSGTNHRYKTLGHDPLFGWIFGTSNIMTNTLTNHMGKTFHVKNSEVVSFGGYEKTAKMFEYVRQRSMETPTDLGLCIIKQGLHIMSDTYSKGGIALPGTVGLNAEFAKQLSDYGLDLGNSIKIGSQAGFSILINQIIAMIHGMYFDKSIDGSMKLYSVKTRKILMYSNTIASASNVIGVAVTAGAGAYSGNSEMVKKSLNYLDIGGMVVTIHRIVTDKKFIRAVKQEFLENEFYRSVLGDY